MPHRPAPGLDVDEGLWICRVYLRDTIARARRDGLHTYAADELDKLSARLAVVATNLRELAERGEP